MSWAPLEDRPAYTRIPDTLTTALAAVPVMAAAAPQPLDLAAWCVDQWPAAPATVLASGDDHRALAAVDAACSGTYVQRSSIPGAVRGVFAARAFATGECVLPFFGQIVYHDLDDDAYRGGGLYGEGLLPAALCTTIEYWGRRSLQVRIGSEFWEELPDAPTPSDPIVSVVPPPFCATGWANAPPSGHPHNAEFVQRADPVISHKQLCESDNLRVRVTRPIKEGEELFVCYGEAYDHY